MFANSRIWTPPHSVTRQRVCNVVNTDITYHAHIFANNYVSLALSSPCPHICYLVFATKLTPWLMEHGGTISHSQGFSSN